MRFSVPPMRVRPTGCLAEHAWSIGFGKERPVAFERFDQLLQEKLDELDHAAEQEARLAVDEVELLRLRAAHLATARVAGPWHAGAAVQYQQDPAVQLATLPPTLDIRFPARVPRAEPI